MDILYVVQAALELNYVHTPNVHVCIYYICNGIGIIGSHFLCTVIYFYAVYCAEWVKR